MKTVILIHGLFMNPIVMKFMERNFSKLGYNVHQFNYKSVQYSDKTLLDLENLIDSIKSKNIHLVGHSMGGLIARRYIEKKHKHTKIQSIITIGTPHNSSLVGKVIENSVLKPILGSSGDSGILKNNGNKKWTHEIPLGCIAGISNIGINSIFKYIHKNHNPSDGTVFLDEAILSDCTDSVIVKYSHTGLIYNTETINLCDNFIKSKKFNK